MPKFYFDVFDGSQVLADHFGDEFESEQEAARQALSILPELARDMLKTQDEFDMAVSVRNQEGEVIYRSVSATRSQWPDRTDFGFRVRVHGTKCMISRSRATRCETSSLSESMRVNASQMFNIIESAAADVEVSRRSLRGDEA